MTTPPTAATVFTKPVHIWKFHSQSTMVIWLGLMALRNPTRENDKFYFIGLRKAPPSTTVLL